MLARHALLVVMTTLILAAAPRSLPAANTIRLRALGDGHVAAPVEIAGSPLRMLVDTGATRSLVRATVAERLHLTPRARFALHTPTGVVEAVCAGPIGARLGSVTVSIECLGWSWALDDTAFGGALDGVLAADALAALPVWIDPGRRRLVLGEEALAVTGEEVPLALVEGRPVVTLSTRGVGGVPRRLRLVLDSGASELILFGSAAAATQATGATRLATLTGRRRVAVAATPGLESLRRAPRRALLLPSVTDRGEDGLLPLSAVGPVAFDWRRGVATLGARATGFGRSGRREGLEVIDPAATAGTGGRR